MYKSPSWILGSGFSRGKYLKRVPDSVESRNRGTIQPRQWNSSAIRDRDEIASVDCCGGRLLGIVDATIWRNSVTLQSRNPFDVPSVRGAKLSRVYRRQRQRKVSSREIPFIQRSTIPAEMNSLVFVCVRVCTCRCAVGCFRSRDCTGACRVVALREF